MDVKCAFLLALIACLDIASIEGIRPFWPESKAATEVAISINTIEATHKKELGEQRSQPSNMKGEVQSEVVKNQEGFFGKSGTSAYNDENDFRPTTPGNSPGVGHKLSPGNEQKEFEDGGRNVFTAGTKEDYRPTQPGHSPGVGHSLQDYVKLRP